MQSLALLLAAVSLCAGSEIPTIPGDNSHYVEGMSRYIWMPDGDGVPHLVDLEQPVNEAALSGRNGAQNQYWLFTRRNPTNAQVIVNGNVNSIRNSNYNGNRPLMVIVHGWNSNGNSGINPRITAQYLHVADANVIVVDWRGLANGAYTTAVRGVPGIGRYLGNFVSWLLANGGGNWNNVHLVGFSLGAHVVGNAGRTVGRRASRVTGLDPAGPQWGGNANALNRNDGQYVETIHTDGGALGIFDPIADADFYPNGGRNPQPGCALNACSHSRAYELFAATVRYNRLIGRRCANISEARNNRCGGATLHMGNSINNKRGPAGLYGMSTGRNWPF